MMHTAWSSIEETPYCFSRSSVKLWGHTGNNIADFESNWAFPDLLQFELKNSFEMMHKACHSIEEVPYCFSRSSIKFAGNTVPKINDSNPILSKNTRRVAAIKSTRFGLVYHMQCLWMTKACISFWQAPMWWYVVRSCYEYKFTYTVH